MKKSADDCGMDNCIDSEKMKKDAKENGRDKWADSKKKTNARTVGGTIGQIERS